jgi:hypothetical protein
MKNQEVIMNVYLKEITDWSDSKTNVPNHTYIVRPDGHLAGYIKTGTKEEIMFKSPMKQFSKSRRKFIDLKR